MLSTVIFALTAAIASGVFLQAQESPESRRQERPQNAMPRSGALVGLSSGHTLWIAPVQGKIRITENQDYVIPRRDGFWRIRLGLKWAPPEGVPSSPGYERLWTVPLTEGNEAVPWKIITPAKSKPTTAESDSQNEENGNDNTKKWEWKAGPVDESLEQKVTFLGPDYISFYQTQTVISSGGGTGGSETYFVLKITDAPPKSGRTTESLLVQETALPIPDDVRSKDLEACIDPNAKDDFRDEDFLRNAQELTYGIRRGRQQWQYGWLIGYSTGAARGYHTDCPVSLTPPKSIVGYDEMFPGWKTIQASYPKAEDAFSSPTHDLILVLSENRLIVASLHEGTVGQPLAQIEIDGKPVMVQWATGKYVDSWTKELTPFFETYATEAARELANSRRETMPLNDRGMSLMDEGRYKAAAAEFVKASQLDKSCNPLYPNNTGYAYYKMGDYLSAVAWIGQSMRCDPKYAIAYLNRGDAFVGLYLTHKGQPKRDDLQHCCIDSRTPCVDEARKDYQKYLELAPDSKTAAEVKRKMSALSHVP